jgi:hypothetical protein
LENLKVRNHLEEQGTDERIILERILEKEGWKDMDWVQLIQG